MAKYAVITPVFNSFDLMERYFLSLENQTYKDFEVIIVDDCSTDNSYEELINYAQKSKMDIHVLRSDRNRGPGNARNIGIDEAKAEWITFVDNDDWVEVTLLERINQVIEGNAVNCVIYDYFVQNHNGVSAAHAMYCGHSGKMQLSDCIIAVRNHSHGKFYRRENCILHNIRYPEVRRCEDVAFVCQGIAACEKVYYLQEPLYYYYQRSESLSNNKKLDEIDMVKAFTILEQKLGEKFLAELKEKSVCDLLYGGVLMMCKAGKRNIEIKNYINDYNEKYPGWEKCKIIDYLGTSKKIFLKFVQARNITGLKIMAWVHTRLVG